MKNINLDLGIGMRSIKTGIAVLACLFIYTYTPLNDPVLAVIVAIASIQNSIDDSVTFGKNRIIGTILGTILGIAYKQIAQHNLFFIAIGVIILITLLNKLNQSKSILIAMAVFVSIITGAVSGNSIIYGLNKFINTMLGITVGFLINYFIKPPNQIENFKSYVIETVYEAENLVKELIFTSNTIDLTTLKQDIQSIETSLDIYNQDKKYNAVTMDKIKYVERSIANYSKLYSMIELIKGQRAPLNSENIVEATQLFEMTYAVPENIECDETYMVVYNYHIKEILKKVKKIQADLMTVSKGKAIKKGWRVNLKSEQNKGVK